MKIIKFKKYWPFLFLICISLTPLLWFKGNMLIAGGDHALYLNPSAILNAKSFTWNPVLNGGESNFGVCHLFPFGYFWYIFQKIGWSNLLIEKIWFIFIWFLGSLSIYKLASYLTRSFKYSSVAGVFAALLYQFNTYKMLEILDVPKHLTYMVLPLLLYFFVKGLDTKKNRYAVYFSLTTLLFASAWVNPSAAIVVFFPPFVYFFYYILFKSSNRNKKAFLFVGKVLIFTFLVNLWWIIPFCLSISTSAQDIRISASAYQAGGSKLIEAFRFMGFWGFREIHYLMPYYPYCNIYYNTPILFLTYSFFLIALFPFFYFRRLNKEIIYLYLLLIVGIFLAAGKSSPFGFLFSFLYRHFPGFWIFREPYTKFTPLNTLSVSILFGIAVIFFFQFIDKRLINTSKNLFCKIISSSILTCTILISAFPLLTGDCIWHYWNGSMRSHYVKIPEYWNKIGFWLNNNSPHSRIFTTPKTGYGQAYDWDSGVSVGREGISMFFIPNSYLIYWDEPISISQKMTNFLYDNLLDLKDDLAKALSLFGVRYVLQKNDLDWRFAFKDTYSPKKMKEILKFSKGIYLKKSFGKLDLYEVSDRYFLPHIYPSIIPIIVNADIQTLASLAKTKYLDGKPALFFSAQNERLKKRKDIPKLVFSNNEWKLLEPLTIYQPSITAQEPEITFKKINPTKYLIKVEEAKNPFWLVFSESFHKQWKLYRSQITNHESQDEFENIVADYPKLGVREARHLQRFTPEDIRYLFKKPLDVEHHLINGYANSWYIKPEESGLGENFILTMYFWPQSLFYLGLGISGLAFLGCISYLLWPKRTRLAEDKRYEK